jgi:hypothetical protein
MYYITGSQARQAARSNITIFNEITAIMQAIMIAADESGYSIVIDDGTVMTESTPIITVECTVPDFAITVGDTLIINNQTIVLGNTGTSLLAVIADINDSGISGLVASKSATDALTLAYTCPQTQWSLVVGDGTANSVIGLTSDTYNAPTPDSTHYFKSWTNELTSRKHTNEIYKVKSYFSNIGYDITILKNTNTNNTFKWVVNW